MPNGEGRNWVRLCAAVDGFRARYGTWPTKIKISTDIIDDLRIDLSDEMFAKIATRVKIIDDDTGFIAEDDQGRQYDYAQEGFSEIASDITARAWFERE